MWTDQSGRFQVHRGMERVSDGMGKGGAALLRFLPLPGEGLLRLIPADGRAADNTHPTHLRQRRVSAEGFPKQGHGDPWWYLE